MKSSDELNREEEHTEFERSLSSSYFPDRHFSEPVYNPYTPKNNSITKLNRHTGQPHEHKREITRRLKQK